MGKSTPSAPAAPDPNVVAAAQTGTNIATARTTAALNRVNQVGPDGSITYSRDASVPSFDAYFATRQAQREADPTYQAAVQANGPEWAAKNRDEFRSVVQQDYQDLPGADQWTMTTALSPQGQRIYDYSQGAKELYGNVGVRQLQATQDQLATPFQAPNQGMQDWATNLAGSTAARAAQIAGQPIDTDYNGIRDGAIEAAMSRLNPQFAQEDEGLRARLAASGITEGSEAWDNAYRPFSQEKNDARMQAVLQGGELANQAIQQTGMLRDIPLNELGQVSSMAGNVSNLTGAGLQQAVAAREVPLNETAALATGQQVAMPQLQGVPQVQVAPTDYLGATMGAGQLANQKYQAQLQARNAQMGGLYGLAGTGAMAMALSDRRAKKNIRRVGETDEGTPIYTYSYKGDPSAMTHMGVMAQELMRKQPDAVRKRPDGLYAVAYSKVH